VGFIAPALEWNAFRVLVQTGRPRIVLDGKDKIYTYIYVAQIIKMELALVEICFMIS
jgi:hypothetical protein